MIRAYAASLPETPAIPPVPQGWKLVPVDLTKPMWDALFDGETPAIKWRDALAAAPDGKEVK